MKRIISAVIVVLLIITATIGCNRNVTTDGTAYNLYFANQERNNLVVETRNIDADGAQNIAVKVIEELIAGPAATTNSALFSKDAKLLSIEINQKIASVNFNKAYFPAGDNADTVELLARYSLVNTLCEIDGIDKVKIFVDGVELVSSTGSPVGALGKDDILLNSTTAQNSKEITVDLYFPDKNAINLVPESRIATLIDNNAEKTIVHELVKGPSSDKLMSTIPPETKVLSVETKDGICFVNLSSDFVNKHTDGSVAETFTIYSIVNSLTELDNVTSVQFLIESKKIEVLKHMLLDTPYTRNEDYVSK